jgi:hypothetical protein
MCVILLLPPSSPIVGKASVGRVQTATCKQNIVRPLAQQQNLLRAREEVYPEGTLDLHIMLQTQRNLLARADSGSSHQNGQTSKKYGELRNAMMTVPKQNQSSIT